MGGELFCKKEEKEHLEHTSSRFEVKIENCTPKLLNFCPKGIFWAHAGLTRGWRRSFSLFCPSL